jgi:hypothetical protein
MISWKNTPSYARTYARVPREEPWYNNVKKSEDVLGHRSGFTVDRLL